MPVLRDVGLKKHVNQRGFKSNIAHAQNPPYVTARLTSIRSVKIRGSFFEWKLIEARRCGQFEGALYSSIAPMVGP